MRPFILGSLLLVALGCGRDPSVTVSQPSDGVPKAGTAGDVVVPHPVTKDPEFVADEKAKNAQKSTDAAASKKASVPAKTDPAVLGEYRFVMSAEQKALIDSALEGLRKKAAAGDETAKAQLAQAEQAATIAGQMTLTLKSGDTYSADFGQGSTKGTFVMRGTSVVMTPDDKPTDASVPRDVEFVFDKATGTLSASFQGQGMTFKKN